MVRSLLTQCWSSRFLFLIRTNCCTLSLLSKTDLNTFLSMSYPVIHFPYCFVTVGGTQTQEIILKQQFTHALWIPMLLIKHFLKKKMLLESYILHNDILHNHKYFWDLGRNYLRRELSRRHNTTLCPMDGTVKRWPEFTETDYKIQENTSAWTRGWHGSGFSILSHPTPRELHWTPDLCT